MHTPLTCSPLSPPHYSQAHTLIALAFFVGALFLLEVVRLVKAHGSALVRLATLAKVSAEEREGALGALNTLVSWGLAGVLAALGETGCCQPHLQCVCLCGCVWLCVLVWLCVAVCGCVWLCVAMCGYVWLCFALFRGFIA